MVIMELAGARGGAPEQFRHIEPLQPDPPAQFLLNDRLPRRAYREMHLATGREQHLEQPHTIDRTRGTGDRDHQGRSFSHVARLPPGWTSPRPRAWRW